MRVDPVDVRGEIRGQKAKCFVFFDGTKEVLVPRCQADNNDDGTITIPLWLAEKLDLAWTT